MRIGLTMDVHWALQGDRPQDCLDREWNGFLERALPGAQWVPLPNVGMQGALRMPGTLELDGLIFTSGANLGRDPLRDETELALLDAALEQRIPVLGTGRGLLLFQTRFKGKLVPMNGHADLEHRVFLSKMPWAVHNYRDATVGSRHRAGIAKLAPGLLPFAADRSGNVEGAFHETHRLAGVLWDMVPEGPSRGLDLQLLRSFFASAG